MSQLLDVLRFELAFRRRHPPLWIFTGLCFVFGFLSVGIKGGMSLFGGEGTIAINSPVALQRMMLVFCLLLGLVITTAFVAAAVNRDHEHGIQGLFFATPLRKLPYLLGRFGGSLLAAWFMISGLALGAMLASVMPWHDPERVVALSLTPYVYSLGVFLFPNLLLIGAISFSVATLTRRAMFSYVALLGLLVVYIVSGNYISDLDNDFIAAVSDPFGLRTYGYAVRYWTPAEQNTLGAPFTPEILINRAIWVGVAFAVLAGTLLRYRMTLPAGGGKPAKPDAAEPSAELAKLPVVQPSYDLRSKLAALRFQTRVEVRALVRSAPFLVIALFGIGNIVGGAFGMIERGGTTTLPVTHVMLEVIEGGMSLFMLIVLVFYAGELIHRERKYKVNELYDALPIPNWVPLVAKLAAMLAGMLVLLAVAAATTVSFQLGKGYTNLELGLYVRDILLVQLQVWVVLSVAAVVAQVIVNHKFLGYTAMVLIFVLQAALPAMDFEHNLYNFAAFPRVTYSDMNGYGHFVAGQVAFTIYWGAAAVLLMLIAELAWARGTDNPLRSRILAARARLTRGRVAAITATALVWLGAGGFIFYNTTVLNEYLPSDEVEELQVRYEQEFKQYESLPHPRITAVSIAADLYPKERRVEVRGTLHLVNKTEVPIDQLHVLSVDSQIEVAALEIPGATLHSHDEALGYRIYTLAKPMQPGEEFDVTYDFRKHLRGFGNQSNDSSIVANGSFFNSTSYMPHFGYSDQFEIADPNTRRDHDLPERLRMPKIDDAQARKNTYISSDSDWVTFAATVSTDPDQIAVAPGYLQKEWTEGGRRYFRYEMDAPILNFWSVLSAEYTVKRDEWRPSGGGDPVAIEIFYHEAHAYNVDKMIESIEDSLDYFTTAFSPYQHRQVRILEFPQYANFAQSFPNTIPYSESLGFIADGSDPEAIDYVYYVTSHEVAHQWWAHQVIGANVQGATLMSESLAQYSALAVMQQRYGPDKMPKFLKYELNRYLRSRSSETIEELPLLLVENQQYIHYNKASLVFYALAEYIGEQALNQALSDYIAEVGFQAPPYTISYDLYEHLKRATPDRFRYLLEDMFERITLYDNRALAATLVEREDGKFDVQLELQVSKLYADSKGVETPAETLDDWIEVGVYVERERDGETIDEPLYLELHRFDQRENQLTITVDERPTKAGVDPRNLLIDRAPRDNTRSVAKAP
ncbi:ABC transporter permease/M1 family aminopeptidase [Enhygromyxa salina]|uniref:ABC-2 family transporter protein n=1 Tax=Enhygromyxa salina TaxID=215803 RepID=A0A2S9XLU1_9BACT|nr:M1 family aminopeptidase [Enhygromyxa salina]PRP93651.1 ABC-2 family transporter protein [Enhygromyxa salina]